MQIECNFFIDSLRCYFSKIYVQYISTIEYGKDRKKIKTGSELMKYVRCERPISHYSLYISLFFIHEKTSAIYRIANHTSIENVQQMMRTFPISYNIYEKMTQKERKEKSKTHMKERKRPNVYVTCIQEEQRRMKEKHLLTNILFDILNRPVPSLDELACFFCTVLQIYSLSFKYLNILYKKKHQ
jgi:hypothetical protein